MIERFVEPEQIFREKLLLPGLGDYRWYRLARLQQQIAQPLQALRQYEGRRRGFDRRSEGGSPLPLGQGIYRSLSHTRPRTLHHRSSSVVGATPARALTPDPSPMTAWARGA